MFMLYYKYYLKFAFNNYLTNFQIQYSHHQSQFAFLQVLSQRASQTITYHCKNSIAWLDEKMNTYEKSIKLLALNGYEYSSDGHVNAQPKVIRDECKVCFFSIHQFPYQWKLSSLSLMFWIQFSCFIVCVKNKYFFVNSLRCYIKQSHRVVILCLENLVKSIVKRTKKCALFAFIITVWVLMLSFFF